MSFPKLVRADTLDLQDHQHPSARDHTRVPSSSSTPNKHPNGAENENGYHSDQWGSGRSSHEGSELLEEDPDFFVGQTQHEHQLDQLAMHGVPSEDAEMNEGEEAEEEDDDDDDEEDDDEEDDDDMTDKISSSPSISDGMSPPHSTLRYMPFSPQRLAYSSNHRGLYPPTAYRNPFISPRSRMSERQSEIWTDLDSDDSGFYSDDDHDEALYSDPRYVDFAWTCMSLQETEDIDFEFVYALHTFVATVEGQANATKGDTMVLLDDSNSYWWLVRVVKDNSIGYLPAEHIETPTERLARLNKHRNIDLAQSMLGDMQEKTKNPLKKAMRRRNAKVVQFSTPTYFEPSENEWSDEESDREAAEHGTDTQNDRKQQVVEQNTQQSDKIEPVITDSASVEPLKLAAKQESASETLQDNKEDSKQSEDSLDSQERELRMTRNGTIRNTDSFFKDQTAEPKKITLTPNILREGSMDSPRTSESKEKPSTTEIFDQIEKTAAAEKEKTKEVKAKKEKKPGMLSGLFKRNKDKKLKVDEAAGGIVSKRESGAFSSPGDSPIISGRESPTDKTPTSPTSPPSTGKRQGGKLSKAPPAGFAPRSPTNKSSNDQFKPPQQQQGFSGANGKQELTVTIPGGTEAIPVESSTVDAQASESTQTRNPAQDYQANGFAPNNFDAQRQFIPGRPAPTAPNGHQQQSENLRFGEQTSEATKTDRSVSPVSPITPTDEAPEIPTASSSAERRPPTESSFYSTTNAPESVTTPSNGNTPVDQFQGYEPEPTWDDAALRKYMEDDSSRDVHDLLLIIKDDTNVVPVSYDHPIMVNAGFQKQQQQLQDMSDRLDGLLTNYLARKKASKQPAAVATN